MATFGIDTAKTVSTTSSEITEAHFGINHVFEEEGIGGSWMKFDEIATQVSPGNIRYQGGSGAEKHFDITNDAHFNSGLVSKITEETGQNVTPLDTFLKFCGDQGPLRR